MITIAVAIVIERFILIAIFAFKSIIFTDGEELARRLATVCQYHVIYIAT